MTLYLLDHIGVFDVECTSMPAIITVVPVCKTVTVDGQILSREGTKYQLPVLPDGRHVLVADGRTAIFRVQSGRFCAEFDPKLLLPTVARLCNLEGRLKKIEQKLADSEVNWLK